MSSFLFLSCSTKSVRGRDWEKLCSLKRIWQAYGVVDIYHFSSVENLARANDHPRTFISCSSLFCCFTEISSGAESPPSAFHPNVNYLVLLSRSAPINNQVKPVGSACDTRMIRPNPYFLPNFQLIIRTTSRAIECEDPVFLGNSTDLPTFKFFGSGIWRCNSRSVPRRQNSPATVRFAGLAAERKTASADQCLG
jgi:hypothetical protein